MMRATVLFASIFCVRLAAAETLSVEAAFADAIGPDTMIVSYCGGAGQPSCVDRDPVQVRWGDPAEDEPCGLGFSANDGSVINNGPFVIGSLTHYNFPTWSGTSATGVWLNVEFMVTAEDGTQLIFNEFVAIELEIDDTVNDPEFCAYPSTVPCADKVTLVGGVEANTSTYVWGNYRYTLSFLGFRDSESGEGEPVEAFISDEGDATTAYMVASFEKRRNAPPDCSAAVASEGLLWPPNHAFHEVSILGVEDADGDPLSIEILGVFQDEPLLGPGAGQTFPDAQILGNSVSVRAERQGGQNGRVYSVLFKASDTIEECTGAVEIGVPHDRKDAPVADPMDYDATGAAPAI